MKYGNIPWCTQRVHFSPSVLPGRVHSTVEHASFSTSLFDSLSNPHYLPFLLHIIFLSFSIPTFFIHESKLPPMQQPIHSSFNPSICCFYSSFYHSFIYPSIHLSVHLPPSYPIIHVLIYAYIHPSIRSPTHPPIYSPIHLSIILKEGLAHKYFQDPII